MNTNHGQAAMTTTPAHPGHGKPKCGGKTRSGNPCTRPSGWGTSHPGIGRCKLHGGSTPSHVAAAKLEQARRDVALFGARREIHPADALLELVQWTAGEVDYWRSRVRAISQEDEDSLTWGVTRVKEGGDDRGTTKEAKPHVAYVMYADATKRLEQHAAAALRAGVEERRVRIAEDTGRQLANVVRAVLDRLGLSDEQRQMVTVVVPEELRRVAELEAGATQ